jgi:DNA-binding response OmpR family regulator
MNHAKILIADDSEKLLAALSLQLEHHGFEVVTCTDAYMALAHARKNKPDLMILDIRMPAGDGFSVMERMRKISEISDVPVIYVTGDQSSELDLKAERLGACALIRKPISFTILLRMIDTVLEARLQAPESASAEGDVWNIPDPGVNPSPVMREVGHDK